MSCQSKHINSSVSFCSFLRIFFLCFFASSGWPNQWLSVMLFFSLYFLLHRWSDENKLSDNRRLPFVRFFFWLFSYGISMPNIKRVHALLIEYSVHATTILVARTIKLVQSVIIFPTLSLSWWLFSSMLLSSRDSFCLCRYGKRTKKEKITANNNHNEKPSEWIRLSMKFDFSANGKMMKISRFHLKSRNLTRFWFEFSNIDDKLSMYNERFDSSFKFQFLLYWNGWALNIHVKKVIFFVDQMVKESTKNVFSWNLFNFRTLNLNEERSTWIPLWTDSIYFNEIRTMAWKLEIMSKQIFFPHFICM